MATQATIFNQVLVALSERRILTSENREPQLILNDIWNEGALIDYCLEEGYWSFARRISQLSNDPDTVPQFGLPYAFTKPADMVRLETICLNEFFTTPLLMYSDDANFWYTIANQIFIKYTSNSTSYGRNMGNWPEYFTYYVQMELAARAAMRITKSESRAGAVIKLRDQALRSARSKDGMNEPTIMIPLGTWSRSRLNNRKFVWEGIYNNQGTRDY